MKNGKDAQVARRKEELRNRMMDVRIMSIHGRTFTLAKLFLLFLNYI